MFNFRLISLDHITNTSMSSINLVILRLWTYFSIVGLWPQHPLGTIAFTISRMSYPYLYTSLETSTDKHFLTHPVVLNTYLFCERLNIMAFMIADNGAMATDCHIILCAEVFLFFTMIRTLGNAPGVTGKNTDINTRLLGWKQHL